jgi:membrane-associated phospholipid phosphatase
MVFEEIIINQFLQSFSTPLLDIIFQLITYFGHPLPWFVLSAWLFWAGYEKKSFTLMTILLFSSLVSGALKQIIARPRPTGLIALDDLVGYSMPSGHSLLAATLAGYTYFCKELNKHIKAIIIILALLTGVSRLYLGVHFLSDVLVGLLLGVVVGFIIFKLETKINKANFHISKIKEEALLVGFFILVIISDLIIPSEYYGAYAILGYFIGYAIFRHTKLKENLTLTKTKTQLFIAFVFGTGFLGILGVSAYYLTTGLISQILFFLSGIFITLVWPIIISLLVEKREERKIKKILIKKVFKKK